MLRQFDASDLRQEYARIAYEVYNTGPLKLALIWVGCVVVATAALCAAAIWNAFVWIKTWLN